MKGLEAAHTHLVRLYVRLSDRLQFGRGNGSQEAVIVEQRATPTRSEPNKT